MKNRHEATQAVDAALVKLHQAEASEPVTKISDDLLEIRSLLRINELNATQALQLENLNCQIHEAIQDMLNDNRNLFTEGHIPQEKFAENLQEIQRSFLVPLSGFGETIKGYIGQVNAKLGAAAEAGKN